MKKLLPILVAGIVFVAALAFMRPEPTVPVPVAAADLPEGHIIVAADLQTRQMPNSAVPPATIIDSAALVGETIRLPRVAGDFFYASALGGEQLELAPNERAIAVHVTDSGGLSGLIKPGDYVGLTATLQGSLTILGEKDDQEKTISGAYSKYLTGGLRVLYISPDFIALDPAASSPADSGASSAFSSSNSRQRRTDGVVVVAVPVDAQVLAYDFLRFNSESEATWIYLVDLLPALDSSGDISISLLLEPRAPAAITTSGMFVPDLIRPLRFAAQSPTETPTPDTLVP